MAISRRLAEPSRSAVRSHCVRNKTAARSPPQAPVLEGRARLMLRHRNQRRNQNLRKRPKTGLYGPRGRSGQKNHHLAAAIALGTTWSRKTRLLPPTVRHLSSGQPACSDMASRPSGTCAIGRSLPLCLSPRPPSPPCASASRDRACIQAASHGPEACSRGPHGLQERGGVAARSKCFQGSPPHEATCKASCTRC